MKAAVLHGVCDVRYETVPDPKIEPNSIVIKVKLCGICGSDLHTYKVGERKGLILGHEFSGDVVQVGSGVDIKEGERVIALSYRPCRQCYWCKQGIFHRCTNLAYGGEHLPGALAEYILIPFAQLGLNVFRIPDDISYEEAATVEPVSIGFHSIRRAQPRSEDTVVVLGTGMIGLGVIQVLKALGVAKVIASGRRFKRLQLAKMSGADQVIDAAKEDALLAINNATSGLGVDIVFECAGSPVTFHQAIEVVRGGGKVMLVGVYEVPISWNPNTAVHKNVTMIGCEGGNFPRVLELLESHKINTKPLISHQFPLSNVREAFEVQREAQDAIKVMVKM